MSGRKDMADIFALARDQGWTAERTPAGHMQMVCPCHEEIVVNAAITPGDRSTPELTKSKLRRHGWMDAGEWKQHQRRLKREAKKQRRTERLAAAPDTEDAQEEMTSEDGGDVPQVGDVARVTKKDGGSVNADELGLPASKIIGNVELAAELLWEKVMEHVREDGPESMVFGTVRGYRWEGSRDGALRELWPSIPRGEPGGTVDPRKLAIARYLKATNNMVCLEPGNRYKASIWWVRANFSKVISKEHQTLAERRVTAAEAGEDRLAAPVTVTHVSTDVTTEDEDAATFTCPNCDQVCEGLETFNDHRLREHGVCPECGRKTQSFRIAQIHRSTAHGVRAEHYERNRALRDKNAGLEPVASDEDGFRTCPDCRFTIDTAKMFGEHRRQYLDQPHPDPAFPCKLCKARVETAHQLRWHYQEAHDTNVTVCRRCGDVYHDRSRLHEHKVRVHRMRKTKQYGELYPGDAHYDEVVHDDQLAPGDDTGADEGRDTTAPVTPVSPDTGDPDADAISYFESLIKYQREQREAIDGLNRHLEELERENSELRREVERLERAGGAAERQRLIDQLNKITRERDDLHLKLETLRSAFKGLG